MCKHIDNLSTPDLITTVYSELPIDTNAAFVEADNVKKDIMDGIFSVSNLTGLALLNSNGQSCKESGIGCRQRSY